MGKTKTAFVSEPSEDKKKRGPSSAKADRITGVSEGQGKIHISGLKGGQRVKIVEAAPTEEAPIMEEGQSSSTKASAGFREPKVRSKKYVSAKAKIDPAKRYTALEAVKLVKETSYSKFDGTIELHVVTKKAGVSANLTLPHMAGREKKIEIASDETVEKLQKGMVDYDILVATPEMMPRLVPFAKILGPKGLMPNPKNGTLVADPKKLKGFSAGSISLKTEKDAPLIHTVVGKVSQEDREIEQNIEAILKALGGSKQIERAFLKSTMSPSVKLQVA